MFATRPANMLDVNPVTCTLHVVASDFEMQIPMAFEFVKLSANALVMVAPFILTMFPTATDASHVAFSMVLSPVEPPPEP